MSRRDSAFGFPFTVDPGIVRSTDALALPGSNQAVYARVRDAGPISKVGLEVGTASGNISVGVYRNTGKGRNAKPGARLATTGAIACPAAGYQEVTLDKAVWVYAGDWLAISADNATATFRALLATAAASNLGKGRQYSQITAHPLPAAANVSNATVGETFVLVGVR